MWSKSQKKAERQNNSGGALARSLAGMLSLVAAGCALCGVDLNLNSVKQPLRAASLREAYGKLPLAFEENRGQSNEQVKFLARANGFTLFLTTGEIVLDRGIRLRLVGANPASQIVGLDELPGETNYFIGNDPAKWRTGIKNYARVEYRAVYPGIDLAFYGNAGSLEYDWVVHPGADPRRIRMSVGGTREIRLDSSGELILRAEGGEIRLHKPRIYLQAGGSSETVAGGYALGNTQAPEQAGSAIREVAFEVGSYDPSRTLVIDPVLSYTALIGSNGASTTSIADVGLGIAVDSSGAAYVVGAAFSSDFPTVNGFQNTKPSRNSNTFVLKVNPAGTALVYSTFLGSSGGESSQAMGIAVDSSGAAIVTGTTGSGFPLANATQATYGGNGDVYVSKLSPTGSALVYSTYLGGAGLDEGTAVAVDAAGNEYVTGDTASADFPTTAGAFQKVLKSTDAFVAKFGPSGGMIYSTLLGGTGDDLGKGIAADPAGNVYVAGYTSSSDFPTIAGSFMPSVPTGCSYLPPCRHGFVTKLNPSGSAPVYSTYLGGTTDPINHPDSSVAAVAVDASGNAYVVGGTTATDFPVTPGAFQTTPQGSSDGFVSKLNPSGSALLYSTRIGGSGTATAINHGNGVGRVALDSAGNVYILGGTNVNNFPTLRPIQVSNGGCPGFGFFGNPGGASCNDVFIAKLNPSGSGLIYSTYFGGGGNDTGNGIAIDTAGNAYVTGQWGPGSGGTAIAQFPQVGPLRFSQGRVFLAKITETNNPVVVGAVTNGASFIGGLAPGKIASIFGSGITTVSGILTANAVPLPTQLAGTSLTVNGVPAPLFAVANVNGLEQINFQAPWETSLDTPTKVVVTRNGASSDPVYVRFATSHAGIFMIDANTPAIQHAADYSLVNASNPARRGEVIIIYATGLGFVQPNPGTGNPAPSSPLSQCTDTFITVGFVRPGVLGAVSAQPLFCGLAPGFVGLYQVNVRIPDATPQGAVISISDSNQVPLAVQ